MGRVFDSGNHFRDIFVRRVRFSFFETEIRYPDMYNL